MNKSCKQSVILLMSSSFLLPSRKHLFSELTLRRDHACQRLHQVFVENPVVQSFVKSITIMPYEPLNYTSLIAVLRLPFCCLESFSIIGNNLWTPLNWNVFSSELKDALSTVIHLSTLKPSALENSPCRLVCSSSAMSASTLPN